MRKYDSYKDSGIEWIGEIPSHWEAVKLKYVAKVQTGRTPKIQNSKIDYFENGTINWFTPSDMNGSEELVNSKRNITIDAVENDEVELFSEYSLYLVSIGATLGKVGFSKEQASANQQINVITFFDKVFNSIFGYYYMVGNKEMITLQADYTTLPILNQSKTKDLFFLLPPLSEQTAIANYLDLKTSEIDQIIADKKRLLELYEEEKTAIINKAVTKGINPDAPMKDSGIEWLGEIPEHWEVKRLKYVGQSIIGIIYSPNEVVASSENAKLVLRASNIQNGELTLSDTVYVTSEIREDQILRKGDVLICSRSGSESLIGKNILIDERVAGETFGAFMTVFRTNISSFVYYYFNSQVFKGQTALFKTTTINQLTISTLNSFVISVPPIQEQQSIVNYIESECSKIDFKKARTEELIELLTEYRTALISEAVTGKIKVIED